MNFLKKFTTRVLAPTIVWVFVEKLYPLLGILPQIKDFVPYVGELARFWALAGIVTLIAEEVIRDAIMPPIESMIKELCMPVLTKAIGDTGTIITTHLQGHRASEAVIREIGGDPALAEAKEALIHGNNSKAITSLELLVKDKPGYENYLLTVLLLSPARTDWEKAKKLIPKVGESRHYLRLAYNYWAIGDLPNAIKWAEEGYEKMGKKDKGNLTFENSLAYYYADSRCTEKSDLALQYAEAAVKVRKQAGGLCLASALATLGFVKITFGKDKTTIESGLSLAEDARRQGASEELYFQHVERVRERLANLEEKA